MDIFTASSLNSGNSLRQNKNVVMSSASMSNCSGKSSRSIRETMVGLVKFACSLLLGFWRFLVVVEISGCSAAGGLALIKRGNRSAAFSV